LGSKERLNCGLTLKHQNANSKIEFELLNPTLKEAKRIKHRQGQDGIKGVELTNDAKERKERT
jgi:hypothetical protein